MKKILALLCLVSLSALAADNEFALVIRDHRFEPASREALRQLRTYVWHGDADATVSPALGDLLAKQWQGWLAEPDEQLRYAASIGINRCVLLPIDTIDWDPQRTAQAITAAIRDIEARDGAFDLVLFGNESADAGGYQVGLRDEQLRAFLGQVAPKLVRSPANPRFTFNDGTWTSLRQNLPPVVLDGKSAISQNPREYWGDLKGEKKVFRSGLCVVADGRMMYTAMAMPTIEQFAEGLIAMGCVTAMQLDVNFDFLYFVTFSGLGTDTRKPALIHNYMVAGDRVIKWATKDFIALFDPSRLTPGVLG